MVAKVDYETTTIRIKFPVREKDRASARKLNNKMMDYIEQAVTEKEQWDAGAGV